MSAAKVETQLLDDPTETDSGADTPLFVHLVLKPDWPIALCGYNLTERFGTKAPARDRCPDCLRIARDRALGRPGWE